ncbi:hypothetical protein [Nocardioides litoris]|uniref:hypothetical protein n=1 Tax=Nocardioides litoris TaxID=1926648 RepID=UPI00111FFCC1|nr:hypothetical protein [Nocardioides litoris]
MPNRPAAVSRRLVLGASLLGVAGCSLDLDPTTDDPTIAPSGGPGSPVGTGAVPEPDDDADLVASVLGALAVAHRTARVNARRHPDLARRLRPLERLHATHAAELGRLPSASGVVADAGEDDAAVLARVGRAEARLERSLADAALEAASGALAQTLAAMAAGTAQLRTTLGPSATAGGTP